MASNREQTQTKGFDEPMVGVREHQQCGCMCKCKCVYLCVLGGSIGNDSMNTNQYERVA